MPLGGRQRKVLEPETAEWPKSLARFRTHLADALPQICAGGWLSDATQTASRIARKIEDDPEPTLPMTFELSLLALYLHFFVSD